MPDLFSAGLELQFEHRHSDGSWQALERAPHDPAALDPEAGWADGEVFICRKCDEQVRVKHADDDAARP